MLQEEDILKETLLCGNTIRFKALGCSMLPMIRGGSLLTVSPINPDDAEIGDVLFTQNNNITIVHRLVKKTTHQGEKIFITRGDYRDTPDLPLKSENILGKIIIKEYKNRVTRIDGGFHEFTGRLIAKTSEKLLYPILRSSFCILKPLVQLARFVKSGLSI